MSNKAKTYTAAEWRIALGILVIFLVGLGIYQMTSSPSKTSKPSEQVTLANMQHLSEGYVKAQLKDPSSAQFKNQRGACGEVNSKNGFGGYTGFKRYIGASQSLVVVEGEHGLTDVEFASLWEQACN